MFPLVGLAEYDVKVLSLARRPNNCVGNGPAILKGQKLKAPIEECSKRK